MKFNEIIFKMKIKDDYDKELFFDLLFLTSKKVKTRLDFITYRNDDIDFKFETFFNKYNKYRISKMPIEYIFNKVNFCNEIFYIEQGVFIPRKETECIIWNFINKYKERKINNILDLCSGSGIISCVLKMWFKESKVIGIEQSKKAVMVSNRNKLKYNLDINFVHGDVFLELKNYCNDVDFVFFNPPYISTESKLHKSLSYEPTKALFAKNNGTFYYDEFFDNYFRLFKKKTLFLIEFGSNQKQYLSRLLKKNNIINFEFARDIYGKYRFLFINF
ncbi:MAG: HemK family protein methyltransferase [Malacoplasma sp.]